MGSTAQREGAFVEGLWRRRAESGVALPTHRPVVVVSYGGGTNSVALLIWLARNRTVPRAIVMADPGSERAHTVRYRDEVMPEWLERVGFPAITVVSRADDGSLIDNHARRTRRETLAEECERSATLPSAAYGHVRCSTKHKADPVRWWLGSRAWLAGQVAQRGKVLRAIGYDFDEPGRLRDRFDSDWEHTYCQPWYPLHDARLTRDDCEALILSEGLPLPGKSSCTFCPNSSLAEWEALRRDEPERFAEAVEMSRRALPLLDSPDVVGLMRCMPHGKRQLHVWADGGYDDAPVREVETDQPCGCAL